MAFDPNKKLKDSSLGDYAEVLIKGNGFGHESLWIKTHFKEQSFGIVEENIDSYTHNICQFVMTRFFEKEMKLHKIGETYYDDSGEISVTYENVETDLGKHMRVYKNAMVMYEAKNGDKFCVSVNKYGPREIVYRIYAPKEMENILQKWIDFAVANNMYKNKKIDADCQFLKLTELGWEDIILPKQTEQLIKARVNEMFELREFLDANNIPLKGGVILSGPPGTGKTLLCKMIARETNCTVIYALPDHLSRTTDIKRVCEMAKALAPCVIIIEDIDYIAEDRESARNAGAVIELMNYLDGVQEFNNVITLATTNAQDKLEDAIKNRPGRFDRVIQIPRPDEKCRLQMLKRFTSDYTLEGEINWQSLAKDTKDLSGAHIKDVCKTAALYAIRQKSVDKDKKVIVSQLHFDAAIKEVMNIDYSSYHKLQSKKKIGFTEDW